MRNTGALNIVLPLLRRVARLSRRQLSAEAEIDLRLLRAVEAGRVGMTVEIANQLKSVLRGRGVSDSSLSLLDSNGHTRAMGAADYSKSDLSAIEGHLSEISRKLTTLVSGQPGYDLKAVINRLEAANTHLSQIAQNTRG